MSFVQETKVQQAGDRYVISLSPAWEGDGALGGFLAAIALRAAGEQARIRRPVACSTQFLAPARRGELVLSVAALRSTRRTEVLRIEALFASLSTQVLCVASSR